MAIEILIHNVGHHDIWALYGDAPDTPRKVENFKTHSFSRDVLAALDGGASWSPDPRGVDGVMRFAGAVPSKKSAKATTEAGGEAGGLVGVCLPILPAVLDAWLRSVPDESERRLVLLHSEYDREVSALSGPSTAKAAELIARWARARHPTLSLDRCVNKSGDPFHFAGTSSELAGLQTLLGGLRRDAAGRALAASKEEWSSHLRLALSASTGTDAVIWSLAAQLMPYRPRLFHVPMARREPSVTRLHAVKSGDASVFRAAPPGALAALTPDARRLRDEMVRWRDEFAAAWRGDPSTSELKRFWLRKTAKPVLAVLMTRAAGGELAFHRGCNLEVSMPTGSLCAERNAIGTALAANPSLSRRDILGVAVLSLADKNPIDPCGACNEWITKIAEVSPEFRVLTFVDETCEKVFVRHVV